MYLLRSSLVAMGSLLVVVVVLAVVAVWTGRCQTENCGRFVSRTIQGSSSPPFASVPDVKSRLKPLTACLNDQRCLSVSYDSDQREASLYDRNDDRGGMYELATRCPRRHGFYYSRSLDICFSRENFFTSWPEANAWCQSHGGVGLLVVDTPDKLALLEVLLKGKYFLGAKSNGKGFFWLNGNELLQTVYFLNSDYNILKSVDEETYVMYAARRQPPTVLFRSSYPTQRKRFLCEY